MLNNLFTRQMVNVTFCLKKKFSILRMILCLWLISGGGFLPKSFAQEAPVHWTDLDSFRVGYQIGIPDDTLAPHEEIPVHLYLEYLEDSCLGVNFQVEWANGATLDPSSGYTLPDSSWLGQTAKLSAYLSTSGNLPEANLILNRIDSCSRSGSGKLATLYLTIGDAPLPSSALINSTGGGLILEENFDLKTISPPKEKIVGVCYPNPFKDRLNVQFNDFEELQLGIYDPQGVQIYKGLIPSGTSIGTERWQAGVYLILLSDGRGKKASFKVIKD